jgi:hypothetical protein
MKTAFGFGLDIWMPSDVGNEERGMNTLIRHGVDRRPVGECFFCILTLKMR